MNVNLQHDTNLTHAVVNFLSASFRGKFAYLNCLAQLNYRKSVQEDILRTEKTIETVQRWVKDMNEGMPLLSVSWREPETFEARRSFDLLKELKAEQNQILDNLHRITQRSDPFQDEEDVKFRIAALIRHAYTKDNFIKGFLEYAKAFNRPDLIEMYSQMLPDCADNIQFCSALIKEFKQSSEFSPEFRAKIHAVIETLPPLIRMGIHDINTLAAVYSPEFTYEMADISRVEGQKWEQAGFPPKTAGYWNAVRIDPITALAWAGGGFSDALIASQWIEAGFDPALAAAWQQTGIYPGLAAAWQQAGYTPEQVVSYLKSGVEHPDQIKKSQT